VGEFRVDGANKVEQFLGKAFIFKVRYYGVGGAAQCGKGAGVG